MAHFVRSHFSFSIPTTLLSLLVHAALTFSNIYARDSTRSVSSDARHWNQCVKHLARCDFMLQFPFDQWNMVIYVVNDKKLMWSIFKSSYDVLRSKIDDETNGIRTDCFGVCFQLEIKNKQWKMELMNSLNGDNVSRVWLILCATSYYAKTVTNDYRW